jgi:hypothetical protein
MTESIKNRMGGSHVGKMNDKELRKLFLATLTDLQNLNTVVANLVAGVGNMQTTVNALAADVVKISNNTNAPNNTVQITATAVTTNLNNISALNLAS